VYEKLKTAFNERKLSRAETGTKEKILKENTHILPNFLPYCTLNMTVAFHDIFSIFYLVLAKASKENRSALYQHKVKVIEEVKRQNKLRAKQIL